MPSRQPRLLAHPSCGPIISGACVPGVRALISRKVQGRRIDFRGTNSGATLRPKEGATHDRLQAIAALKARSGFQQEVKIAHVAVNGNTGIAWGINIIKDPSGKVLMHIAFTDVFRYENARWVAVAAEETPVRK